jgi:hypothetical protein
MAAMTAMGLVTIVGCGSAAKQTPPPPVAAALVAEKPGAVIEEDVVSVAATVVKVDQKKRVVTLRDSDGKEFEVKVGDEVRNLAQVKKGDQVVTTYYESLALMLKKPGEAKPGLDTEILADRAKLGEKPAGTVATQTTLTSRRPWSPSTRRRARSRSRARRARPRPSRRATRSGSSPSRSAISSRRPTPRRSRSRSKNRRSSRKGASP